MAEWAKGRLEPPGAEQGQEAPSPGGLRGTVSYLDLGLLAPDCTKPQPRCLSPVSSSTGQVALFKIFGTRSTATSDFGILEYGHIHDVTSWGWDPSLNRKLVYVTQGVGTATLCL